MKSSLKIHITKVVTVFALASLPLAAAWSTDLTIGGEVGSVSAVEGKSDTKIGFGGFVQGSALDILSLQVDYFSSRLNDITVQGLSPSLMWHLVNFDELKLGLLAGPGFYKEGNDSWRFGLQGGAFGEVSVIPHVPIGLQVRYHSVFGGENNDLWSVFMTIGYRFSLAGGNDW